MFSFWMSVSSCVRQFDSDGSHSVSAPRAVEAQESTRAVMMMAEREAVPKNMPGRAASRVPHRAHAREWKRFAEVVRGWTV